MPELRVGACSLLMVGAMVLGGCGGSDEDSSAPLPGDFFGIVADDVYAGDASYRRETLERQRKAGIRLIRQTFDWSLVETRPGHYDFSAYDDYVADLAQAGMAILPILFSPPTFHSSRPKQGARRGTYPPSDPKAMARYAAELVRRYGPRGTLWTERKGVPRVPIHSWQVWNEPSFPTYWPAGADAREYAELLVAVSRAIRNADPSAEVVAAGLSAGKTAIPIRDYVTALHAAGGDSAYDVLAIHPYAATPDGSLAIIRGARRLLDDLGKEAPIWVTEIGWASQGPSSPFTVSTARQGEYAGRFVEQATRLREALGLRGLVYYNWRDAPIYPGGFDFFGLHAGLLDIRGRPKPALETFTRATQNSTQ